MGTIGVAISTTGDEHRMRFLETCVRSWDNALRLGDALFVTVDGTEDAAKRVAALLNPITGSIYRVGQRDGRQRKLGVAINKNTGLELLMGASNNAEHLFLCDDDTWPLYPQSLDKHTGSLMPPHSMVCWGRSRLSGFSGPAALWSWPRGVMLYQRRSVVEKVGGMDEAFGPGGHEHVEYSRRIHQHGFTPAPFLSPLSYSTRNATGASALWHAEDMRRPYESGAAHGRRRAAMTSVERTPEDWPGIEKIMAERDRDTTYVPYTAHENGRASATLCASLLGRGAGGEK